MWAYNGQYPGPVLSWRQGDTLRVRLHNDLPQPTTVHWHGIRVPNAYDGVPGMTQDPVQPGKQFDYRFVVPDAGTYWYHPHVNTIEQIGRGLIGALVVHERKPPEVDADWLWALTDLRLDRSGQIV
ncbi:MAG: multicopper oxidase domain-containing protein, partial [Hylemonella sp.]